MVIPSTTPHFGFIIHISVRMKFILISTLDDRVLVAGHMSDVQFAELLDYWHRNPRKLVTYQPGGPDGMQARQVQIHINGDQFSVLYDYYQRDVGKAVSFGAAGEWGFEARNVGILSWTWGNN